VCSSDLPGGSNESVSECYGMHSATQLDLSFVFSYNMHMSSAAGRDTQ